MPLLIASKSTAWGNKCIIHVFFHVTFAATDKNVESGIIDFLHTFPFSPPPLSVRPTPPLPTFTQSPS